MNVDSKTINTMCLYTFQGYKVSALYNVEKVSVCNTYSFYKGVNFYVNGASNFRDVDTNCFFFYNRQVLLRCGHNLSNGLNNILIVNSETNKIIGTSFKEVDNRSIRDIDINGVSCKL